MKEKYTVPSTTKIGHVHLKVADLDKSLGFYKDLLGFEVTSTYGKQAAFLSAGGYHHHIGLNTWHSAGSLPAPEKGVGLYHTAILYATRKELARIYHRIRMAKYPMTGASDHGVSQALYLNDPDGNGVELYWDRPKEHWSYDSEGSINMLVKELDLDDLLQELY